MCTYASFNGGNLDNECTYNQATRNLAIYSHETSQDKLPES